MDKQDRREVVSYTIVTTELGPALVAATEKGVRAVAFGEPESIVRLLAHDTPQCEFVHDDSALADLAPLVAQAAAGREIPAVPLDLRGTPFQREVWNALTTIPRGTTVTYAELAAAAGRPRAVRAAASACGDNRVAVLVPCHRVVRTDGSLGGYRWGVERKRALLASEARETGAR